MTATDSTQIFLQYPIFSRFLLPFFLVFFILYAVFEKTKILGGENHKINALVSFVIGLIFVTVLSPTLVLTNLVLFLSIAIVIVLIVLMLWGFMSGDAEMKIFSDSKWVKPVLFIVIIIAVLFGVLWAFGVSFPDMWHNIVSNLFYQSWSGSVWTNILFGLMIAVALALVIGRKATKKS